MKEALAKMMTCGVALTTLLAVQPVVAQCCPQPDPCCNPCSDWCDMCGDWEIGAHALYFSPMSCPFTYVTSTPPSPTNQFENDVSAVPCEADWGVRVFGRYVSDCSFFGLSYQWLQAEQANTRTTAFGRVPGSPAVNPAVGRYSGIERFEYQNVDARWGKYLRRTCGGNFYLAGNVRWVDLSGRQTIRFKGVINDQLNNTTITQKASLQGGAIGVATGAEFNLWCNFGIFGDANIMGVIADRSTDDVRSLIIANGAVLQSSRSNYPSETCIIPEVEARLGINYQWTCGCWTVVGELGYEVDYFWNAFAFPRTMTFFVANTEWLLDCQDIGFSGLFFGGKLLF